MSEQTKIEWTQTTWNPVTGCSKVSEGCRNCYAIRDAWRMAHNPNERVSGAYNGTTYKGRDGKLGWTGHVNLLDDRLEIPFRLKGGRVFVNSQSDLFHPQVPFEFVDLVMVVVALNPQLTFQVLTKRPERMAEYFRDGRLLKALNSQSVWGFDEFCIDSLEFLPRWKAAGWTIETREIEDLGADYIALYKGPIPLPNLWLGVSVEDQGTADERIPLLLQTPAAVHWISAEPLLGETRLDLFLQKFPSSALLSGRVTPDMPDWTRIGSTSLDWVVVGGESGPGARPFHLEWARDLRAQCRASGVPFFLKQLGRRPLLGGETLKFADKKGGDMAEWPEDLRVREFPETRLVMVA